MRAESAETERPLGVLTRGVTTTHGEIVSGVVNGQVTLTRPGGDGSGAGASKMMAAGGATDITMHDLNDTVNHAIPLRIEKLPRLMVERQGAGKKWAEDGSTTSTEDEPFDPWLEAKRRQTPTDKPPPQRDPWEGYCRKTGARDTVWEGWQHFDYADEDDRETGRSHMGPASPRG